MRNKHIISFETAIRLKYKNKYIEALYHYTKEGILVENSVECGKRVVTHHLSANTYDFEISRWGGGDIYCIAAPTQSELQKWLRDVHKIHISILSYSQESWTYRVTTPNQSLDEGLGHNDFNTYEDALEDALFNSLNTF